MQEDNKFEFGTVVRLITGSPRMIVENVVGDEVLCKWLDGEELLRRRFPKEAIQVAEV